MKIRRDEWLRELAKLAPQKTIVPTGGFTAADYAQNFQMNIRTANMIINRLLASGDIKQIGFRRDRATRVFDVVKRGKK